jgi:hypothetical protein
MDRCRNGPTRFLKDYNQVLLADGYAGYNGVVVGNAITRYASGLDLLTERFTVCK